MNVILHAGHEHTETATSAAGTGDVLVVALGSVLVVAVLWYGIRRYAAE